MARDINLKITRAGYRKIDKERLYIGIIEFQMHFLDADKNFPQADRLFLYAFTTGKASWGDTGGRCAGLYDCKLAKFEGIVLPGLYKQEVLLP